MHRVFMTSSVSLAVAAAMWLAPVVSAADLSAQDRKFMQDAAKGGMMEVRMGHAALESGSSAGVKGLGQRLVDDHTKGNDEIMELAKKKGVTLKGDDHEMPKGLAGKKGADFDKAFADAAVKDHEEDIKEFEKEASAGSDPDVKAWASKTLPTLALSLGCGEGSQVVARAGAVKQSKTEMPLRKLGRTGETVSAIGLGGHHIGLPKLREAAAIRIIHEALDRGMNFLDNSWDYHEGESEKRVGKALQGGYRKKAFVMTKVDGRTRVAAARQLDESLRRLRTDHIDLLQHHEIIRFDDADRIFSEGGAMEAFVAARKAGKIRFIGFTGHKDPHIHLHMLATARRFGFRFDTVQMPLNLFDTHYRSFEQHVLPELVKQGIGVLGMKSMGSGVLLKSRTVTPKECLHYAMNLPSASVVITGIDSVQILHQAFEAAQEFQPMSRVEVARLRRKSAEAAEFGQFELFKTTTLFDSTVSHPEWLGKELPQVRQLKGA